MCLKISGDTLHLYFVKVKFNFEELVWAKQKKYTPGTCTSVLRWDLKSPPPLPVSLIYVYYLCKRAHHRTYYSLCPLTTPPPT